MERNLITDISESATAISESALELDNMTETSTWGTATSKENLSATTILNKTSCELINGKGR